MRLDAYPRPPQDTRIGVHWSPGISDAVGITTIRERWIPLLKEMGVSWVKLLHPGGLSVAELLLEHDIMPVVRLYRPQPNSSDPAPGEGTLGPEEIQALEAFVQAGVRYFEFNNEPDLGGEWRTPMPPDPQEAMRIVARNALRDMETILNRGGLPAIPAVAVSSRWDLMGAIIAEGGRDLLEAGAWWAVHNYDINHPLDYPYDPVNQEGRPLTPEEYEALGPEAWEGPTWGRRSLEFVNQHRENGKNPGATLQDDNTSWLAYEYFAQRSLQHLGYHIPILSTENGPLVGEDPDPRYPTTTPAIHRDKVVEMCRIMMGTSEQFPPAPDYYFCTAFWVLGSQVLGGPSQWEGHAWFSDRWPEGRLPVVDALRALPKRLWQPRGNAVLPPEGKGSRVWGRVKGGAGYTLSLQGSAYRAETTVQADERFIFDGVPAGVYRLQVQGTEVIRTDIVVDGVQPVEVNLDLTAEVPLPPRRSRISGRVVGGAGMRVRLTGPALRLDTPVRSDETFEFSGLPAGVYTLTVEGTDIRQEGLVLDGTNEISLTLEVPTPPPAEEWTVVVEDGGPGPGFGVVRCEVVGKVDLPVRLWTDGWEGTVRRTGTKPEYGPYVCEFAPLGAGRYYVEPEGLGLRATVPVDGWRVVWVRFRPTTQERETPPVKVYDLYLWVERLPETSAEFAAVLAYTARFAPEVGAEVAVARKARRVVVLAPSLPDPVQEALESAGSQLVFIGEPWDQALWQLVRKGKPIP